MPRLPWWHFCVGLYANFTPLIYDRPYRSNITDRAMTGFSLLQKLRSKLRAFDRAREGSVVVWFAMASLPMAGFVGAAVDYSHANSVRTAMQMALDSTALMLSKEAANLTTAQLNTKATAYFSALYTRPEVTGITITPTYTTDAGSQVTVAGSGNVKAAFMGILGVSTITIHGTSTVTWGNARMRVALALDTTGSMNDDGKMPALKTAAKSLLTQLKKAATKNGDVYVSIVPFSKDVNVGKNFKLDSKLLRLDLEGAKYGLTGNLWLIPMVTDYLKNTWNGCVADRDTDYDIKNTAPDQNIPGTLFPVEQYNECPAPLMPLSYDWSKLEDKINELYPAGATNQVIGLQWAFQSLTSAPFTIPAKEANYSYSDVIILMTDGLNTQSRHSNNQASVDAREKLLCANIKAAKITIYAIHVNTGGDPAQQVLKDCASDATKYFEIKQANQLLSVFTQIGTQLSQLRISK